MRAKRRNLTGVLSVVAVLAVVAALLLAVLPGEDQKTLTASFPRTVSLYEGSDVRILGVPVGTVDSVVPTGTDVTVTMSYDAKYKVPADAKAVIVSPAIVGDRFVQLTPVWTDGDDVLESGAELTTEDTATPLELDEIYQSIDDLTVALGPQGANSKGALTNLLDSTAENFAGQGDQFHQTIENLGKFTGTLANNKDELFGTVSEVEKFTSTLSKNDDTVRRFNDSLASGAQLLADERQDLAAVLQNLSVALTQVKSFVAENRNLLSSNIKELNQLSKVLVKNRAALDETLTDAPVALNNLFLAYNESSGTLDTRANVGESVTKLASNPSVVLCALVPDACGPLSSLVKVLGLSRAGALAPDGSLRTTVVEPFDPTLGGLVEVRR